MSQALGPERNPYKVKMYPQLGLVLGKVRKEGLMRYQGMIIKGQFDKE